MQKCKKPRMFTLSAMHVHVCKFHACKFSFVKKMASHKFTFFSCFQGSQPKPNQKSPGRNFPDAPKSGTSVSGPFILEPNQLVV